MKYSISPAQMDDFCDFVNSYLNETREEQYGYKILEKDIISNQPYIKVRFECKKNGEKRVSVCDILFHEYSVSSKWVYTNFDIDFECLYLQYMASIFGEEYLDDALNQREEIAANIVSSARLEFDSVLEKQREEVDEIRTKIHFAKLALAEKSNGTNV